MYMREKAQKIGSELRFKVRKRSSESNDKKTKNLKRKVHREGERDHNTKVL